MVTGSTTAARHVVEAGTCGDEAMLADGNSEPFGPPERISRPSTTASDSYLSAGESLTVLTTPAADSSPELTVEPFEPPRVNA
jgi:hypothetical protein